MTEPRSDASNEFTGDNRTAIAWPAWMLRYIATDDEGAFWDLVWSVGGSPPYGGVSYDEAKAVYDLLEDYRGPGQAAPTSYERVAAFAGNDPMRRRALDAFRINDTITSAPESFTEEAVILGTRVAEDLDHDGLRCLFKAYAAQIAHQHGNAAAARDLTIEALKVGLPVAAKDPAYARRIAQCAQNAVSFTALAGDRDAAIRLQAQLADIIDPGLIE